LSKFDKSICLFLSDVNRRHPFSRDESRDSVGRYKSPNRSSSQIGSVQLNKRRAVDAPVAVSIATGSSTQVR
jgi:hypothetical protein